MKKSIGIVVVLMVILMAVQMVQAGGGSPIDFAGTWCSSLDESGGIFELVTKIESPNVIVYWSERSIDPAEFDVSSDLERLNLDDRTKSGGNYYIVVVNSQHRLVARLSAGNYGDTRIFTEEDKYVYISNRSEKFFHPGDENIEIPKW